MTSHKRGKKRRKLPKRNAAAPPSRTESIAVWRRPPHNPRPAARPKVTVKPVPKWESLFADGAKCPNSEPWRSQVMAMRSPNEIIVRNADVPNCTQPGTANGETTRHGFCGPSLSDRMASVKRRSGIPPVTRKCPKSGRTEPPITKRWKSTRRRVPKGVPCSQNTSLVKKTTNNNNNKKTRRTTVEPYKPLKSD